MADVVGVVFRTGNKVYNFDPAGLELSHGDRVVVQTMRGMEVGQVVDPPHQVPDEDLPAPLKRVVRIATGKDLEAVAAGESVREQALVTCRELIVRHGLDMKLVDAEVMFGGEKVTFSFCSEERVDFRALVSDLAKALKMRIELRQIGAREEARVIGGLGPCGRHLCCTLFPGDDQPVSIRMAKEQNLPLNPLKISGLCGRLMCCLKYEQEQYVAFRHEAPNRGTTILTPQGEAVVIGYHVPKGAVTVRYPDGSSADIALAQCHYEGAPGEERLVFTCEDEGELALELPDTTLEILGGGAAAEGELISLEDTGDERIVAVFSAEGADAGPGASEGEGAEAARGRRRPRGRRGRGKSKAGQVTAGREGDLPDSPASGEPSGASRGRSRSRSGSRTTGSVAEIGEGAPAAGVGGSGVGGSQGPGDRPRSSGDRRRVGADRAQRGRGSESGGENPPQGQVEMEQAGESGRVGRRPRRRRRGGRRDGVGDGVGGTEGSGSHGDTSSGGS